MPEDVKIDEQIAPDRLEFDEKSDSILTQTEASRIDITSLFDGRTDPGTKNDLLSKYGGNQRTVDAVNRGLAWLKKQQLPDGSWSLQEPYRNGAITDNHTAATGLALLAFQGDGNTRFSGKYHSQVRKAWKWLLKQQAENGSFFRETEGISTGRFYTQAICTIGICELIGMEKKGGKGKDLLNAAQKAVVGYSMLPEKGTETACGVISWSGYRYMEHLAQADGAIGAAELTVRKGLKQDSKDVSGDYTEYKHKWTQEIDYWTVNCFGNEEGRCMKAIWLSDNFSYSIVVRGQGDLRETYGVDAETLNALVNAIQ